MILLSAFKERMEFPDLKKKAYQLYMDEKPDAFIVEGKASGMPLIFELRAMGIPVQDFVPSRGKRGAPNDKIARANAVSDLFASGIIWRPATRWAEEVADECGSFPLGRDCDGLYALQARRIHCVGFRRGSRRKTASHGRLLLTWRRP